MLLRGTAGSAETADAPEVTPEYKRERETPSHVELFSSEAGVDEKIKQDLSQE